MRAALLFATASAALIVAVALVWIYVYSMKTAGEREIGGEAEEVLAQVKAEPHRRKGVPLYGKGVWLWGVTVQEYGAEYVVVKCKELGITHIFLLVKGTSGHVSMEALGKLLPLAHREGIYVHAWFVCFSDASKPDATPLSKSYRIYLLKLIADFLTTDFSGEYVDGVHLDYIRFKGNAEDKWRHVSSFVAEVRKLVDKLAPGAVLSIASKAEEYSSMEELAESALYYGQNYTDLAKYVDLFCPMTYHLDYGVEPQLVGQAATWVRLLTGKPVFAGIQTHPSENPSTAGKVPTPEELDAAMKSCRKHGVDGVVFFAFHTLVENYEAYKPVIQKYSFGKK